MLKRTLLALLPMLLCGSMAIAQSNAPESMAVQGVLTDAQEMPVNDTVQITFKVYDDANTVVFTQTQAVDVENGFFSVNIGDASTPLLHTIFRDNAKPTLGIQVGTGAELSPRLDLVSVPFAAHAQYTNYAADSMLLSGKSLADFANQFIDVGEANAIATAMVQDNAITTAKIADGTILSGDVRNPVQMYRVTNLFCEQEPGTLMTTASCRANQANAASCSNSCSLGQVPVRDCDGNCTCGGSLCLIGPSQPPCDPRRAAPLCANAAAGYLIP